ncbi:hypothetical protein [Streptomyces sp. SID3343]|uniref:hypothetical protein n=1 Tax=Streptomyces sp. SID3343 TaxID=2690260 RepID=UPI00136D741D|nr:hypothetical protein [Streptomyces sp. SID3343]MYW00390.1 hypothetical protein [Streptomyces sp. SID3343]MYW04593.1 hypothetical protein [Streptomyces sp. SID3343]
MSARLRCRRAAWTTALVLIGPLALLAVGVSIVIEWLGDHALLGRKVLVWASAFGDLVAEPLCDVVDTCLDRQAALGGTGLWILRPWDERHDIRAAEPDDHR